MRRKTVSGILLTLLLASMLTLAFNMQVVSIEPTTSNGPSALFYGTCDNWYSFWENDTWFTYDGAKIVESYWDMIIEDGKAIFNMKFTELNIEEEEPGTYDNFRVVMIADSVEATIDGYIVGGTSYWWKNEVLTGPVEMVVTISETNLPTQVSIEIPDWLITGSMTP